MTDWERVPHQAAPVTYVPLSNGWKLAFTQKIMARWLNLEPPGPATWKSYVQRRLMHAATDKGRPR